MNDVRNAGRIISGKSVFFVITIGLTACLLYIALLYRYFGSGFPFDDAWIHRVYARNLVKYGMLTYNGDRVTVGESSYLYCFFLTLGYIFGIDPVIYMYITGVIFYLFTVYLGTEILNVVPSRPLNKDNYSIVRSRSFLAFILSSLFAVNPVFIALYFNGMATGMTSFLITLSIYLFLKGKYGCLSAIFPLLFLARGETIVTIAVLGTLMFIRKVRCCNECNTHSFTDSEKKICEKSRASVYFLPLICTVLFYCIFHLTVNGTPFPNTAIKMPLMNNLENLGAQFEVSVISDNLKTMLLNPNTFFHIFISSISVIIVFSVCGKYLRGQTIGTLGSETIAIIPLILPLTWYFTYIGGQTYPFINLSPYFMKYWEFTLAPAYFCLILYYIHALRFGLRPYRLRYNVKVWTVNGVLMVLWTVSVIFGGYRKSSSIFIYPPVPTVIIISAVVPTLILLSPFLVEWLRKRGKRRRSVDKILRSILRNKVISVLTVFGIIFPIIVFLPTIGLYGEHIREINSQHVKIGLWVRKNTPQNSIIATHDAGAVKYFSDRKVIDLWALNNMEIFKIYRETALEAERLGNSNNSSIDKLLEERIWEYLISIHVEYIICRPDVFTYLTDTTVHPELEIVYIFYTENSYFLGNNTMICYRINYPATD